MSDEDDEISQPEAPATEIGFSVDGDLLRLIRRMGAQMGKSEVEVVLYAIGHLNNILNQIVDHPVVLKRNADNDIFVGALIEEGKVEDDPSSEWHVTQEDVSSMWEQIDSYRNHPSSGMTDEEIARFHQGREATPPPAIEGEDRWDDLLSHPALARMEIYRLMRGWVPATMYVHVLPDDAKIRWRLTD